MLRAMRRASSAVSTFSPVALRLRFPASTGTRALAHSRRRRHSRRRSCQRARAWGSGGVGRTGRECGPEKGEKRGLVNLVLGSRISNENENPHVRVVLAGAHHDSVDHASDVGRYGGARGSPNDSNAARLARTLAALCLARPLGASSARDRCEAGPDLRAHHGPPGEGCGVGAVSRVRAALRPAA
jgi:hypothetical protein